ncbi:MAG: bifunctional oligoribonuclease/PAP phosphatase NrnA [Candidatus Amesbacteria bacterium]|nr:bifunctional oligoribonuclease/PAP phosphatase NrnA [Candidatus Amesbacteria bacterium]
MSDKIKQFAPKIWSEIQQAQNILLHCHPNSDGDSVGGVLGMKHLLESLGKKVTVIWGDSFPENSLVMLPGYSDILLKNIFEINLSEFDLFIIQDSSSLKQISDKNELIFPKSLMTIVIDHHATNTNYAQINLVDPNYSSVCEIVFDLIKFWKVEMTKDMGLCLFIGMYTDTGGFKYPLVTENTFIAAAEIAGLGVDFSSVIFEMENSLDPKSIKLLGAIYSNIEYYFGGNVAICAISASELTKLGIPQDIAVPEISNTIKSEIGNNIGIFMMEKGGITRTSMRTRLPNKFNLGKIALATGYGGGHPLAAGARIPMPITESKRLVLETIQKIYPDLGQP